LQLFKIAEAKGMTVKDMLWNIDSDELSEWMAYYEIFPTPEDRADIRNAILCATTANAWGGKSTAKDFIPKWIERFPETPAMATTSTDLMMAFSENGMKVKVI
jgi:hypothetical protein